MKLIFLDIDGVLNSEQFALERYQQVLNKEIDINHLSHIDTTPVNMLVDYLSNHGDIRVVLSSSWRSYRYTDTIEYLCDDRYSAIHPLLRYIIAITPRLKAERDEEGNLISYKTRGDEIRAFLDIAAKTEKTVYEEELIGVDIDVIHSYVIVDDDDDMLDEQKNNFVQTNQMTGLTISDINKIDCILNQACSRTPFILLPTGDYMCPICGNDKLCIRNSMFTTMAFCPVCGKEEFL